MTGRGRRGPYRDSGEASHPRTGFADGPADRPGGRLEERPYPRGRHRCRGARARGLLVRVGLAECRHGGPRRRRRRPRRRRPRAPRRRPARRPRPRAWSRRRRTRCSRRPGRPCCGPPRCTPRATWSAAARRTRSTCGWSAGPARWGRWRSRARVSPWSGSGTRPTCGRTPPSCAPPPTARAPSACCRARTSRSPPASPLCSRPSSRSPTPSRRSARRSRRPGRCPRAR